MISNTKMQSSPSDIFSIENLHRAYLRCRKGKRGKINTRGFEVDLYSNLKALSLFLQNGTYQPKRSVCFYVTKPKLREVFAADFNDRVVHRLLVDLLEPEYEKKFIKDSYACRTGKGSHKAVERVKEFLKKNCSQLNKPFYYIQLDIKGYFMEIDKNVLFEILQKNLKDDKTLMLCKTIIFHNPTKNFVYRGKIPPKDVLPPHKTLFHEDPNKGIPIGNLTSQFFANVYLNYLDQYIKRNLGVRYYIRYMDDFLLFSRNPIELIEWKQKIIQYINYKLKLKLKEEDKKSESVYKGIDFLGYFIKPNYTLVRKRVIKNFHTALAESLPAQQLESKYYKKTYLHSNHAIWKHFQSRINSYIGHIKHANHYKLKRSLIKKLKPYFPIIDWNNNHITLRPNLLLKTKRLKHQINFYKKHYKGKLLLIEVGSFYELHGSESKYIAECLNLKKCKRRIPSYYGFPKRNLKKVLFFIKSKYISGVLIKQTDDISDKIKARLPVFIWQLRNPVQLEFHFK